jgi:hypothetical protein
MKIDIISIPATTGSPMISSIVPHDFLRCGQTSNDNYGFSAKATSSLLHNMEAAEKRILQLAYLPTRECAIGYSFAAACV